MKETKKDILCYVIISINNKGKEMIYGTDTEISVGQLNINESGLLLHKEPINCHDAITCKAIIPRRVKIISETQSLIKAQCVNITNDCVAMYGKRITT